MYIEVTTSHGDNGGKELVNLEIVKTIRIAYLGEGKNGTIFKFMDKSQVIATDLYEDVKKRIKKEAQKQTMAVSRFELMEIE